MKKKIKYNGTVKKGEFIPFDVPLFKKAFYKFEGMEISLYIEKKKQKRKLQCLQMLHQTMFCHAMMPNQFLKFHRCYMTKE